MPVVTREDALTQAETIRDEVAVGANTALRVGGLFVDLVDSLGFMSEAAPFILAHAAAITDVATLSGLSEVIDDVALDTDGMVVLLTGQTDPIENGPMVVHSGPWTRAPQLPTGASAAGAVVRVTHGTARHDQTWTCSTDAPNDVVGTDALTFDTEVRIAEGDILNFGGPLSIMRDGEIRVFSGTTDTYLRIPDAGFLKVLLGTAGAEAIRFDGDELRFGDIAAAGANQFIGFLNTATTENARNLRLNAQSANSATFASGSLLLAAGTQFDAGGPAGSVDVLVDGVTVAEFDTTSSELFTPSGLDGLEISNTAFSVHLNTVNVGDGTDAAATSFIGTAGASAGMTLLWKGGTGPTGGNAYAVGGDGSVTDGNAGLLTADLAHYVLLDGLGAITLNHATGQKAELQVAGSAYVRFQASGTAPIAASGTMRTRAAFTRARRNAADTQDHTLDSFSTDTWVFGEDTDGGSQQYRVPSGQTFSWFHNNVSAMSLSSTLLDVDVAAVSIGASPAAAGNGVRVSNAGGIWGRTVGGTPVDVKIGSIDVDDVLRYGGNVTGIAGMRMGLPTGTDYRWAIDVNTAMTLSAAGLDVDVPFISVGTNPAASGWLRGPNAGNGVQQRNQLNTADVNAITIDSSNFVQVGDGTDGGGVSLNAGAGNAITAVIAGTGYTRTISTAFEFLDAGMATPTVRVQNPTDGNGKDLLLRASDGVGTNRNAGNVVARWGANTGTSSAGSFSAQDSSGTQWFTVNASLSTFAVDEIAMSHTGSQMLFRMTQVNTADYDASLETLAIHGRNVGGSGTTIRGGPVHINGGDTHTGSATNRHGGDVNIFGGTGNVAANQGSVIIGSGSSTRFEADGTGVAFNGNTPIARPDYTISNPTTQRSLDVSGADLTTTKQVLGTLLQDLINYGLLQ
jgi:hypothetical protein